MKTLVARLKKILSGGEVSLPAGRQGRTKRIVSEEEILIAKGREQFQRLVDKGLSIPIATI